MVKKKTQIEQYIKDNLNISKKHEQGTLILNGIKTLTYKGEFKNDSISGKGRFKLNEEKEYIEELENNELSGYGILTDKHTNHIEYFLHNNNIDMEQVFLLPNLLF